MNRTLKHIPVMKKELIQSLKIHKNGIYIDSTFGAGGHSNEILKNLGKNGKLYSLDRDPISISIGKNIKDSRFHIIHERFSNLLNYAKNEKIIGKVNGIIFDLGVSSIQIDDHKRGFSFKKNGPLDMRMNPNHGISASDWLFKSDIKTIALVLKNFGEEFFSKKIAFAIKNRNKIQKITSTKELSDIIKKSIPMKNKFKHPAKRTFQAIRIYINKELEEIKKALDSTLEILKPGGRISVISFHSLEDRIVKQFMIKNSRRAIVPYGMPITEEKLNKLNESKLKIISRILPTKNEIKNNPRARSSILRTAEKKE
ncbi:MAG: 16S rRNA (cytosine(1402)-N(4))-methyltransferase RsmH [Buchnera aphidicola (Brevicoryne brassicae)]|uniref:Ribosomal RNA small subunit methyltransferase H n=1 Tax=Buchnera aphidicola (Brevicoryne brassicae) TaxID=911343 RepID=A0AAJ5PUF8_9GAMM|nr:16S rRNA (cytosine(1402)-N(4))-methyltransferase RsmH [Buchnera aphidicola]QCI19795.1 16S rRNA (cytosine(1402)-N(4))-methyltransferase RsmH [Buchnera aphidicola (Brevicoryne brassicae)]WAI19169.1 MAG: 16S rRNA (cytosine(1402)-N(4))-methyltransferase RsmH [Buchnera aphidicola (Brevicoryne brassicae)]